MGKYDDIINLPHKQSSKRAHMSMHDRAAQFVPFAALTGYDDEVSAVAKRINTYGIILDSSCDFRYNKASKDSLGETDAHT